MARTQLHSFLLLAALLARAHLAGSARLASFLEIDTKPVLDKAVDNSHVAEDASADELLEMTDSLAADAANVVRRFLETGAPTYPGPTPSPSPSPSPSPTPTPSPSPSPPLVQVVETVLNVSYDLKSASAEIVLNSTEAVVGTVVDIVALVRESIAKTLGINLTQVVIKSVSARINGVDQVIAGEWNTLRHLLRRMAMEELPAPARSLADSLPALHGAPGEVSHCGKPRPISLAEAERMMAQGSALAYSYDARRLLQGSGSGTSFSLDAVNIDLSVVQYVEVPVEPSIPPPTTNGTTNGTSPSPLPRPSLIPINTTALTQILNATTINATVIQAPSPTPTPTPTPPPRVLFTRFKGAMADGVYTKGLEPANASGVAPFVIWREDADFDNWRRPRNRANLVHDKHLSCGANTVGTCTTCPRAWQVGADSTNATILFREPMQLDRIIIKQLQNPGVLTVQLLPWPAVRIPGLNATARTGTLGRPIWSVTSDSTPCGSSLTIPLGSRAGTGLAVPKRGSQSLIPRKLRSTTVGGINIIVKPQPKDCSKAPGCTFIESVLFDGRVLYPADPAAYPSAA